MKALTLTQPWATLVAIGAKRIETRGWKTDYRGPLAIHAAKSFPKDAARLCATNPFRWALTSFLLYPMNLDEVEHHVLKVLPRGAVVATCNLVDCVEIPEQGKYKHVFLPRPNYGDVSFSIPPQKPELSFGDYTPGRYAWLLDNIEPFHEPWPTKGALGLWEWAPMQQNFFDAVREDPEMSEGQKAYWLSLEPKR